MNMSKQGIFQTVGSGLDHILSLADIEEEQMIQSVDRTAVTGASYFTSVDQSSVHTAEVGSHQIEPLKTSVDKPGSKKTQGEKFFLIHSADWLTTHALFHEVAKLDVVKLLYNEQFAVQGLLRYHTYARFGIEIQVQINPTPFQQGGLICAMVPGDQSYGSIASLTVYPHGLLNCNINNVVRIKVPFIYTRGAYHFKDPQYPVWELTIRVWSELNIGTGTSAYTSLNVLARFTDLELHGLTPLSTQMMRNEFRVSTTENVVNLSNYEDARAKMSFALDQEDWKSDPSQGGGIKITHFTTWTSIPTLAAQFPFNASDSVGQQIKVIPVDPYFFQMTNTNPDQKCITALASICQMFCFWRGDLVFDFQVFPTKYHSGRLLFCFVPGNELIDVTGITLKQATTAPCAVMDITGVQSTLRFRVPWISDTPYRVNRYTKSAHQKGEYTAIGKLIVYCYNRLTSPSNVASHVRVNVYLSAINLECFAPLYHAMDVTTQVGDDSGGFSTTVSTEQNVPDPQVGIKGKANRGKMDVSGVQAPVGAITTIEDPVLAKKVPETFPELKPGESRHTSDHMSIYKFMGRSHFLCTFTFNSNNKEYTFPITLSSTSNPPHGLPSTLRWFFNLFQLYRGPLDLTIIITGATDVDGMAWFTPVGLAVDTPWVEKKSALSIDYKTALGAVRFNTRRTGNIQIRLPWYSYLYAVSGALDGLGDKTDSTFGLVSIQIANYNHSDEYLSFSCYLSVTEQSEFYFPRAPLNSNAMLSTESMMSRIAAGDLESSVDDPRSEEDRRFESHIECRKPYKELRLEVGKQRLKYAQEELSNEVLPPPRKMKGLFSQAKISLFYTEEHEIMKFSWRGVTADTRALRRFGFSLAAGRSVWTLEMDAGVLTGRLIRLNDEKWTEMKDDKIVSLIEKFTSNKYWSKVNFPHGMLDLEEIAANSKDFPNMSETDLCFLLHWLNPKKINLADRMLGLSGVQEIKEQGVGLIAECRTFLDSIAGTLKSMIFGFHHSVTVEIINIVLCFIKSGILLYVIQQLNQDEHSHIIGLLRVMNYADIGCSVISCGKVFSKMLETVFNWQMDSRMMELRTQSFSNWLRDICSGITIFKSFKDAIYWLCTKLKDFYEVNYGKKKDVLNILKDNQQKIEKAIEEADNFCILQIQDVEKFDQYQTSNWSNPSPKTVYVKEAIDRRLHFKVEVKPASFFKNPHNDMLNVNLAKTNDAIKDMSCVDLIMDGHNISLMDLLSSLVMTVEIRKQNMSEFMELWSQGISDDDSAVAEFFQSFPSGEPSNSKLSSFFQSVTNHKWVAVGAAVGILGLLVGGWFVYKHFSRKEEEPIPAEGVYHGVTKPKQVIKLDADPVESQSTLEIAGLVRKNLVQFGVGEKNGCVRWVMNALGVKDDWLLVPSHAYKFEKDYEMMEFYFNRGGTYYSISAGNVVIQSLDVGFQDVVLMKVPTIPKFRDITQHFIKKGDVPRALNRLATLVTTVNGTPMLISEGPLKMEEKATYVHKKNDGTTVDLTVDQAWRGKGEGLPGMCGGALVSSNQSIQNAILGIHVAGGNSILVAKLITQEMFQNIDKKIESQRIMKVEFTQCSMNVVSKTLFRKSPIHHHIDKTMINFPAAMPFSKAEIDPMAMMLSKYSLPIVEEPEDYKEASVFYQNKIVGKTQLVDDFLDLDMAITGAPGIDAINMDSSPGFPYVQEKLTKRDLIWLDENGLLLGVHPRLAQRILFNTVMMENCSDLDVVFTTCPKDELRPLEKVLESKTRAIDACPLDYTILCRMYWGPAISYFHLNPGFHTGVAIGIDPDRQWDELFKTMIRFGDVGLDLDFSAFDASLSPFMIREAGRIMSELSGTPSHFGTALINTIIYSKHLLYNCCYHVCGSMPSGSPCTALLNSIINNINLYYVFSKIFGKSPVFFCQALRILCYGDDVLIVFSRDVQIDNLDLIGQKIVDEFKKLGMTATSADKNVPQLKPVSELTFLKRSFNLVEDRIRPAISEKTIWSLIAWQRSNAEFEQNLENAQWFAFMHGYEFYQKFYYFVQSCLEKEMIEYRLKSYDWWRMRFY
uniref:Genome polyprotein (Fragments) n=1 Tax=Human hepatitis A virus genotype IA (isolate HAS-15) TaxID=470424 RepID=POLG_HAVHA|nr:RecName: Full=Genome polyprotein; Contains: RecName: Full=Capsid protein VP0; AltName: Full=VP4-VP2; Contains: RecName: Full=Capsid protein VP4; AltName: Full=P1A; AltName: Full=Virion protein 4; Contains: RecName: Full=Capsid protein VP2; AltName: Full=P1B; AltName: Full=Virion protein 2; Contains: RecName: Full=Capsid protein VP3; AltName: Full=P1C; AltName: Full=Virion protein 3; Contains: RecName: Full=Protein VP1-2A; AltName: Full=VPX; Contains: RecName: Full=Capsid protein VP1; AltName: Fu